MTNLQDPWKISSVLNPINVQNKERYLDLDYCNLTMFAYSKNLYSRFWGTFQDWEKLNLYPNEDVVACVTENGDLLYNFDQLKEKQKINFRQKAVDEFIRDTKATIVYNGDHAHYILFKDGSDVIYMPSRYRYLSISRFYFDCFHELSHWAEKRVGIVANDEYLETIANIVGLYFCKEFFFNEIFIEDEKIDNKQIYIASDIIRFLSKL